MVLVQTSQCPILAFGGKKQWRRTEVLRDPAFWLGFIWLAAVPSFVLTGLLFHQIYLAEAKGVALSTWTASYVSLCRFCGDWQPDHRPAH